MASINIPAKVRFYLYLFTALGSIVVGYTVAKGYIGDAEVVAWTGFAGLINGLSASKTDITDQK